MSPKQFHPFFQGIFGGGIVNKTYFRYKIRKIEWRNGV